MAVLIPNGKQQYLDAAGNPLVGGKLYTYAAGTNVNQLTWADADQVAQNANPVILDGRGEASIFWLGAYKVKLTDALDNEIWTVNNVVAATIDATLRTELALGTGASLVDMAQAGAGALTENLLAFGRRAGVYPEQFGTLQQAINAAFNNQVPLIFSPGRTYTTAVALTIPGKITIYGYGAKLKAADNAKIATGILNATGFDGVWILGLEIDANADALGADYGVRIVGGSGHNVRFCYIHDTAQAGIVGQEISQSWIDDNRMVNNGRATRVNGGAGTDDHGIMIGNTSAADMSDISACRNSIVGAHRKSLTTYIFGVGNINRMRICENSASGGGLGGIYIATLAGNGTQIGLVVANNVCTSNYVNFTVNGITGGSVTGNVSRLAGFAGFELDLSTEIVFAGNSDSYSGLYGYVLALTGGAGTIANVSFGANICRNPNTTGAGFGPGIILQNVLRATITGFTIYDSGGKMTDGIAEQGAADFNLIVGNNVSPGTNSAYLKLGANSTIISHSAGSNGFGVLTPLNAVDIAGGISRRPKEWPGFVNGANQNVAFPAAAYLCGALYADGPTANFSIGGIAGGTDGKEITINNFTNFTMTLNHNDGGSAAGNQISCPSSANFVVPANGSVSLIYMTRGGNAKWCFS